MMAFIAERLLNIFVRKIRKDYPAIRLKEVLYAFIEDTTSLSEYF